MREIYLAGGCFWGVQKYFDQFNGVQSTEVGYANGLETAPTYQDVCASSGHAETVKIVYDEDVISLTELLKYYFLIVDPLSVNRQGNDRGIQYRTGIYYTDEDQLAEAEAVYKAEEEKVGAKLAVELEQLKNFFTAEEYHQKYLNKNPGGYCHLPEKFFRMGGNEMELSFLSNKEQTWLPGENGSKLVLIDHPEVRPGVVNIVHTEVDPSLGGQGIAGKMTQAVAEQLRIEGRKAVLTCSYAVKWFAKHPEYSDVLEDAEAEAQKAETFGGPACGIRKN